MKRLVSVIFLVYTSFISAQINILPKWEIGFLDIHFISTGKGSAAFYLFPDGTNMLIDAGDLAPSDSSRRAPAVPNNSKTPAQWIVDYITQFNPAGGSIKLDYALITHYHDDHFGHFDTSVSLNKSGNYRMSGITEVGSLIPIKTIIDRGYDSPINFNDSLTQIKMNKNGEAKGLLNDLKEYWKFIAYQKKINGTEYQKFIVGSISQISMKKSASEYPDFRIKNLFSNGEVCSVWGDSIGYRKYKDGEYPGENNLSCGIKISYGKFDFYTGGDINGINFTGSSDFTSMEALAANAIGPVDVAVLNHHGNRDSQNEFYVRTTCPRVWISQNWSSNHPGEEVLRRLIHPDVYSGPRDLFTNFFHPANKIVIGKRAYDSFKATSGHIVIRVYRKGDNYDLFVLNDKNVEKEVIAKYNYKSR